MKTEITLVPSASPSSKPINPVSSFSKAVKSSVIIAAPEADKAKKEHRERGQVKAEVYKQYVLAGGIGAFILLACLTIVGQLVNVGEKIILRFLKCGSIPIGSTYILKNWAEHNRKAGRNSDTSTYLALYGSSVFLASLLAFSTGILLSVVIIIRSARYLHDRVLHALLRCPLSFFETTPSGR
jgi:ATP-binding cassette, subfamily C (CFTR/MRP), member 1